ncbi:hypothetical protein D3C71_1876110 [compost metagenome]
MRRDDAQRYADGDTDQGGEEHLGQGFHGFLPVAHVEDQQERQHAKSREAPFALNQVGDHRDQADQDERVEPGQGAGDAVNHKFQCLRERIEVIGAVLRQPFNEPCDVLAQRYFLIDQHDSERPHAKR